MRGERRLELEGSGYVRTHKLALGYEQLFGSRELGHLLTLRRRLQTARSRSDVSEGQGRVDELEAKTLHGVSEGRVSERCVDCGVDTRDTAGVEAKGDHDNWDSELSVSLAMRVARIVPEIAHAIGRTHAS